MYKRAIGVSLAVFLVVSASGQVVEQPKQPQLLDCRKIVGVKDSVRRGFDERSIISFDIDGDGLTDRITSQIYSVKLKPKSNGQSKNAANEDHWIRFDLSLSSGRLIKSFFKYKYGSRIGTEDVDYWVYAVVPCQMNRGRRINLFFYSGDDTSEEKVILLNQGNNFKVHSRKENGLGE